MDDADDNAPLSLLLEQFKPEPQIFKILEDYFGPEIERPIECSLGPGDYIKDMCDCGHSGNDHGTVDDQGFRCQACDLKAEILEVLNGYHIEAQVYSPQGQSAVWNVSIQALLKP